MNIIYYDKSILPRFFSEYIDLNLWSLKNVAWKDDFLNWLKREELKMICIAVKITEKLLKYEQK